MRSLLWKEWHEQRWKLAFGSLILGAFALIGLRARVVADELLLEWLCFLAVVLLPVMASTGLIASEREDGTIESLLSLPISPLRVFVVKLLAGVLLTIIPLLVAEAVTLLLAGGREMSVASIAGLYTRSLAAALCLFFWMFALTVRLPSETRASIIAMAVLVMWLIVALGLLRVTRESFIYGSQYFAPTHISPPRLWVICPFVFLWSASGIGPAMLAIAVLVQLVISAALVLWASLRFAVPTAHEGLS